MKSSIPEWGGARRGAGRKPLAEQTVKLKVVREVWSAVSEQAHRAGQTPEEYAAAILTQHAAAPLFAGVDR